MAFAAVFAIRFPACHIGPAGERAEGARSGQRLESCRARTSVRRLPGRSQRRGAVLHLAGRPGRAGGLASDRGVRPPAGMPVAHRRRLGRYATPQPSRRDGGWLTMAEFDGWGPGFVRFFTGLAAHNDKAWFEAHRNEYRTAVQQPTMALLAELEPTYGHGKMFRLNRDARFAAG